MLYKITFRLMTLLLVLLFSQATFAQCTFSQPTLSYGTTWTDIGYNGILGQSFTAECSGALESISFVVDNWTGSAQLELYLYAGTNFPDSDPNLTQFGV